MTAPSVPYQDEPNGAQARLPEAAVFEVFGVPIVDSTIEALLQLVQDRIDHPDRRARSICFVNAHTLNLASTDRELTAALRAADYVFGDGTGVRWAVRWIHGHRLRDNVNGTDFVPRMLSSFPDRNYRYYLLGGKQDMLDRAASKARQMFPGWNLVGCQHGYLDAAGNDLVVDDINAKKPDILLVGMGNPRQEKWIRANIGRLQVPLCMAIGGLMAYWSGDLSRAPAWLRRIGFEWVHLMLRQPRKLGRYLLGNPAFLLRVLRASQRGRNGRAHN